MYFVNVVTLPLHSVSPQRDSWRTGSRTACRAGLYCRWPLFWEGQRGPCSPASPPRVWPESAQRNVSTFCRRKLLEETVRLCSLLVGSGGAVLHRWLCWETQRHWRPGQRWCSQTKSGSPGKCKNPKYLSDCCQWHLKPGAEAGERESHPIS